MLNALNDLDDIETQLYNQVFHAQNDVTAEEIEALNQQSHALHQSNRGRSFVRYFESDSGMNKLLPKSYNNEYNSKLIEPLQQEPVNQFIFVNSYKNYVVEPDYISRSVQEPRRKNRRNAGRSARRYKKRLKKQMAQAQLYSQSSPRILNPPEATPTKLPTPVIDLVDSDDKEQDEEEQSCVLIPPNWPQVSVYDSDEEPADDADDKDVIIVKRERQEIISIEDDDEVVENLQTQDNPHKERMELLNTPESNSNDFIENAELQQQQFNFSLHGADFRRASSEGNFVKPADPETNETESSCSTTDIHLLQPVVFNEVEFPREDIFSEANLEKFGDFITPQRKPKTPKKVVCSTPKIDININETAASESSSESDLDEGGYLNKVGKKLPNLSPLVTAGDENKDGKSLKRKLHDVTTPNKKSPKKKKKTDQLDSSLDKSEKKKNKKKKTATDEEDDSPRKQKKRKSVTVMTTINEEIEETVKKKNKKRKSLSENEVEKVEQNIDELTTNTLNQMEDSVQIIENDEPPLVILTDSDDENLTFNWGQEVKQSPENPPLSEFVKTPFNDSWTEDKDKFYSTITNVENFTLENIRKSMSNDPDLWQISYLDKPVAKTRDSRFKCRKCREKGHLVAQCPLRYLSPKCSVCGESGHEHLHCPNRVCLQCCKPNRYLTATCASCYHWKTSRCNVCQLVGHCNSNCPDLWRRYYATTEEGPIVQANGPTLKPKEELWCSGCARKGHSEDSCQRFKSNYILSNPEIYSYYDVYHTQTRGQHQWEPQGPNGSHSKPQSKHQAQSQVKRQPVLRSVPQVQPQSVPQTGPQIWPQSVPQPTSQFAPNSVPQPVPPPQLNIPMPPPNAFSFLQTLQFLRNFPQMGPLMLSSALTSTQRSVCPIAYPNLFAGINRTDTQFPQQNVPIPVSTPTSFVPPLASPVPLNHPLPDFISLETGRTVDAVDQAPPSATRTDNNQSKQSRNRSERSQNTNKKNANRSLKDSFMESCDHTSQLLKENYQRLRDIKSNLEKHWTGICKTSKGDLNYYKKLNMILFGIFEFGNGKHHKRRLDKLLSGKNKPVSNKKKSKLFYSFNYIFGRHRNPGVNYEELMSKVRL